jgi:hypothetical protein
MPKRSIPKTIIATIITVYFVWCAYDPQSSILLHGVYLALHEAGHLLFSPFGLFIGVAGGSIMQIIVPAVFFGYFVYHQKPFSASIVLFWLGQSFNDIYYYANDAIVMQIPLLSGLTGSEGSFHDWNYLLTEMGWLKQTPLIAKIIRFCGNALILAAIIGSFLFATEGEEIVSEVNL